MSSCIISVVIPSYNRAHVLQSCIASIQGQTYQNFEIIIVDDGSIDETKGLVQELISGDRRIKLYCHDQNMGAQAARNHGIKNAKGDWIAFLDSDDHYLPNSLELRLRYVQEKGLKVVYSDCYFVKQNGKTKLFGIPAISGYIYTDLLTKPGPMFQSLLVSRDAIERINYLDEAIVAYQEWDTSIRLAKYYKFGFLTTPTFIYNCRGNETISGDQIKELEGYKQIIKKHFKAILFYAGLSHIGHHLFSIAILSKKNGRLISAKFYLIICRIFCPNLIFRNI